MKIPFRQIETHKRLACTTLAMLCAFNGATAAHAEPLDDVASVTIEALDNASGQPVAFSPDPDPAIAASAAAAGVTVALPEDPKDGISLRGTGAEAVSIVLPAEAASQDAKIYQAAVSYSGGGASTVPLVLEDGTLQILSVVTGEDVDRLSYEIQPESGGHLMPTDSGGFVILNGAGDEVGSAAPPWARDNSGATVPTHYEIAGNLVTQIVDTAGVAPENFPVVADPAISVSSYQYVATNVRTRTQQVNFNKLIGGCRVAVSNSTCTITGSYTEGATINGSLGLSSDQVAATLGVSVAESVTGSMGCTSPRMSAGSSYKAYIMGTYRYFTLEKWKVTKAGGRTVRRLEASAPNQIAFTPINMIYCGR